MRRGAAICVGVAGLITGALAGSAAAAPGDLGVERVTDLNPGSGNGVPGQDLVAYNGALYFAGNNGIHGTELWKTDGTTTSMVKDINPEAGSSSPVQFVVAGGTLYFTANDGSNGNELWKTNGTTAGTAMVANINAGGNSSDPYLLTEWDGKVVFGASNGSDGIEPWISDGGGLGSGTEMVADVNPGGDSTPLEFESVAPGGFFFSAIDSTGRELRYSTGSSVDFSSNIRTTPPGDSVAQYITHLGGGVVVFEAFDDDSETELWRSNATGPGTMQVGNINAGTASSNPQLITKADGIVLFNATAGADGSELWKSDGTTNTKVADINPGGIGGNPVGMTYLPDLNVTYFTADNGSDGYELYRTDGSSAVYVKDINAGGADGAPGFFSEVNGTVLFAATDATHGTELWRTDGTALGTAMVADINPGSGSSYGGCCGYRAELNGALYLVADDGSTGVELHRTFIEQAPPAPPATPTSPATAPKKCKKGQKLKKGKCVKKKRKKK